MEMAERSSSSSGSRLLQGLGDSLAASPPLEPEDADEISSTPWRRNEGSLVPVLPNPFQNDRRWTRHEVCKTALVAVTLFPVRVVGILICMVLMLFPLLVASVGFPMELDRGCMRHSMPFRGWRRLLVRSCRSLARAITVCLGFWHIHVLDRRRDPSKHANIITVAPHLGLADGLLLFAATALPATCFVARIEMSRMPAYFVASALQLILVNLKQKESKQSCKEAIAFRASSAWDGPPVALFPEGAVTNGKVLTQFKQGAFAPGEPVTPVLLRIPPSGDWDPSWVGENRKNPLYVLRLMCQVSNRCSFEILDAYEPDEAERSDPRLFAENLRNVMATELCVQTTDHTYADVFFYQEAALKAGIQSDFTLAAMQRLFDTDVEHLKRWLEKFRQVDTDGTGIISRAEMVDVLDLGSSTEASVDHLFEFFDTDGSGAIEYREFVQALALLSGKCSAGSIAKLAFLLCDKQGTGLVPKSDLRQTLGACLGARRNSSLRSSLTQEHSAFTTVDLSALLPQARGTEDNEMLNFRDFCKLVEQRPSILDAALARARSRLSAVRHSLSEES